MSPPENTGASSSRAGERRLAIVCWGCPHVALNDLLVSSIAEQQVAPGSWLGLWTTDNGPVLPIVFKREQAESGVFRGFNNVPPTFEPKEDRMEQSLLLQDQLCLDPQAPPTYKALWAEVDPHSFNSIARLRSAVADAVGEGEGSVGWLVASADEHSKGQKWDSEGYGWWLAERIRAWAKGMGVNGVVWVEARQQGMGMDATHAWAPLSKKRCADMESAAVLYFEGNTNTVVTCPHGGKWRMEEGNPRRQEQVTCNSLGDGNTASLERADKHTAEMAMVIRDSLNYTDPATGAVRTPHVVICQVHRCNVEANREACDMALRGQCACIASVGSKDCLDVYKIYHAFVELARSRAQAATGRGLLIDLHGTRADYKTALLGYRIRRVTLSQCVEEEAIVPSPDGLPLIQNGRAESTTALLKRLTDNSSVRALVSEQPTDDAKVQLLFGTTSLGHALEQCGVPATPSPCNTLHAGLDNQLRYMKGNYSLERYGSGSVLGPGVDAIQVETAGSRREAVKDAKAYGMALAEGLREFIKMHYEKGKGGCW